MLFASKVAGRWLDNNNRPATECKISKFSRVDDNEDVYLNVGHVLRVVICDKPEFEPRRCVHKVMNVKINKSISAPSTGRKCVWHKIIDDTVRYVLPLGVSAGLIIWLFHRVDFHEVMRQVHDGCDFQWIVLMMVITTLSHIIRGIRWGIQLRGAGVPRMPVVAESVSIFGAYALNLVIPRLGEVWRCVYVSRRERCPISTVVGTDIGDRSSDLVVVLALLGLSLVVARSAIYDFLQHYAVGRDLESIVSDPVVWCGVALAVVIIWAIFHFWSKAKYIKDIDVQLRKMWQGFKVVFTMKGKGMYVVLTFGIWICYFLETYVCFFAFPFTRALVSEPGLAWGLVPGLVVFVFGSCSMAIPSNGGLGPWNLAVMFALSLYGIDETQGTAFSMVMWSCQAAMLVMLGIFSAVYVMRTSRKNDHLADGMRQAIK